MDIKFLQNCYKDYKLKKPHYEEIERYYYGNTDSLRDFTPIEGRSNLKIKANFEQKLIDQEAQYSFANEITYTSLTDDENVIKDINYYFSSLKADHDINLGIELIKFGAVYEINYIKDKKICSRIVTPLEGYPIFDEDGNVKMFLHIFTKMFSNETFIDVYDEKGITHFNNSFNREVEPFTPHNFGFCPVGVGIVGGKMFSTANGYKLGDKTIHATIKTLQDALETNLSDISCEISDTRNSIMKIEGCEPNTDENGKIINPLLRNNSFLWLPEDAKAEWLIKNINDTFIKNTRDDIINLIYTLTSHIDDNIEISSNVSGIALRSRLTQLESKCRQNERAMTNILKIRLKCLFKLLYLLKNSNYDENLIKITYTPCVPVDETALADIISKLDHDVVSNETKRSWLPRISNTQAEAEKIEKERASMINNTVDDGFEI